MLAELHALDNQDTSPMTPAQAKAHHRITALLKKAESTNFEEEAEALILKAETLRQQYRIESLLINSYDQDVQARFVHLGCIWKLHGSDTNTNCSMPLLGCIPAKRC